ncbi:hypothetical protein VNO78_28578 [Psophocarpus tetragonolobus]|uniref:Uncharacterized protein n=1 Tax=Psophocarpus tetragonolobus TaxID=3891 RepID=A0AAN9RTN7_PSOTE
MNIEQSNLNSNLLRLLAFKGLLTEIIGILSTSNFLSTRLDIGGGHTANSPLFATLCKAFMIFISSIFSIHHLLLTHSNESRVGGPPKFGVALEAVVCVLLLSICICIPLYTYHTKANGKCILEWVPSVYDSHSVLGIYLNYGMDDGPALQRSDYTIYNRDCVFVVYFSCVTNRSDFIIGFPFFRKLN